MFSMSKTKLDDQLEFMSWLSEKDREKAIRLSSLIEAERERLIAAHPEMTQPAGLLLGNEKISIYQYKHWDSFLTNPESLEKILTGFLPDEGLDWMTVGSFLEFVHEKLMPNCPDAVYWLMRLYMDTGRLEVAGKLRVMRAETKAYNAATARQIERCKTGGKKSAKKRQQDEVHRCWQDWQAGRGMYKNQEAFILAMQTKLKVSRQSVFNWLKEWKTLQKSTNA